MAYTSLKAFAAAISPNSKALLQMGGKKVCGENQSRFIVELIHTGIIVCLNINQNITVSNNRNFRQYFRQLFGR
jgi:hypothetical protein